MVNKLLNCIFQYILVRLNQMDKDQLKKIGIINCSEIIYNPSYDEIFREETVSNLEGYEKVEPTEFGAVNVSTGIFTGRSPKDKYIVKDKITEKDFWWTSDKKKNDNKPISLEIWNDLKKLVVDQLSGKKIFVIDAFCGANKNTCLKVRFIMEVAWQAHFVKNMFIRPNDEELKDFIPDFHVLNGSKITNKRFKEHNLNSENFIAFNLTEGIQLIGGTWYGGEMKKGMFSVMNYILPQKEIASMHCSANKSINNESVALFFGLSGTGKTTLSTDPKRKLIGDDEHGWDDDGVFNFEGGCYAKTVDLDSEKEPDIFNAIKRDALLENVTVSSNGKVDYNDVSVTENTRVSYPIYHIENIVKPVSKAGHADKVIFLTADAFGVLPAVSILSEGQSKYHFLSGFTSKLAGTERGISKPTPTFSACFGAAFLTLHPTRYANVLSKRMIESNTKAYLVNTGWNGKGKRISLKDTRNIVDNILNDEIDWSDTINVPIFNLTIPKNIKDVLPNILDPRRSWEDEQLWEIKAKELANLFINNFEQFCDNIQGRDLVKFGPQI